MENKAFIENIKSNFILKGIFDFINDKNFILKLFIYSKLFQNKVKLELINYINAYLSKFEIRLEKYFNSFSVF